MIDSIYIKNFRTHQNTQLKLSQGINVIIGDPGSGKTNIIRAVLWALTNRPLGFRFHSDFEKTDETAVRINFLEHEWIELTKNKKGGGQYTTSLDANPLKAIGSDVPNSVSNLCNMSELNIQRQLDRHFLITSSASEVAKTFNRITKLEKIDKTVSLLTTDINSRNKNLKILVNDKQELESKIADMGNIEEMENDANIILELQKDIFDLKQKQKEIEERLGNIIALKEKLRKHKNLDAAIKGLRPLEESFGIIAESNTEAIMLARLIEKIKGIGNELQQLKGLSKAKERLDGLVLSQESLFALMKQSLSLEEEIEYMEKLETKVGNSKKALERAIKEYKAFLKTISHCPFCEKCKTPMEEHDFNLFLKEYEV